MSKRKPPRGPALTDEERELWDYVAQSVTPIRAKRRVGTHETDTPGEPAPVRTRRAHPEPASEAAAARPRWQKLETTPPPRPAAPPPAPTPTFDRRKARRIAGGRVEIEARLDLHGLRESEAHLRLRGFLRQAQAAGKRTVLVITGKGRARDDDPTAPFDLHDDRRSRGVLKRNVPRWLAEPDLAAIVVSFTTAHTRHGGDGALYVHLRRHR
jgi:DNA-nicking Smr family endonuclease